MERDLGDIAIVWSPASFILASLAGIGFGYAAIARVASQPRWRTSQPPLAFGWLVAVLAAALVMTLVFSQLAAALFDGDPLWPRVISRIGPYLVGAVAVGLGAGVGLWRHAR